jgi:drug/metabolite transporter (DMT)-like permease
MTPVWATILSWPVLGERPPLRVWAAVGMCLAGVILISQPHFERGSLGAAAGVGSSLLTAVVMMSLHRLGGVDPRAVVVHFALVATLATSALAATAGPAALRAIDGRTALLLAGLGLAGTFGQIAMTRAFALGNPPRVAIVGLTQIVFGAVVDHLFWHRAWNALTVAGIVLVAAPCAWLLLRQVTRKAVAEPVIE